MLGQDIFLFLGALLLLATIPAAAGTPGTQKWALPTGARVVSSPALGPDGTIYVGSEDGKLYAIYGDSLGLMNSSWPMFHHDLRHTGR